jgi:hypothetical protein
MLRKLQDPNTQIKQVTSAISKLRLQTRLMTHKPKHLHQVLIMRKKGSQVMAPPPVPYTMLHLLKPMIRLLI